MNSTGDMVSGDLNVAGRDGIGTTAPLAKLEVGSLARITGYAWPSTGNGMELAYNPGSHRGSIQVYDRDKPSEEAWGDLYLGNGNVGIGTASVYRLIPVPDERTYWPLARPEHDRMMPAAAKRTADHSTISIR